MQAPMPTTRRTPNSDTTRRPALRFVLVVDVDVDIDVVVVVNVDGSFSAAPGLWME